MSEPKQTRLTTERPIERIAFFGTPEFAVPSLDGLHGAGRTPVVVVSQPSRGVGRGRRRKPPPVARWAEEHGVALLQSERVSSPSFRADLEAYRPDLAIVVAFGQIFRQSLLDLPRLGCVNLHASLLPAHRGAAPVVAAIRSGERRTGVTTMLMERGLDSGPVLLQRELTIGEDETGGELAPRLASLGADVLVETLRRWEEGELVAVEQNHPAATYAPLLERDEGLIDWSQPASRIHDQVRAFSPWPGTWTFFREERLAVKRTARSTEAAPGAGPGEILGLREHGLAVACGGGTVLLLPEVQRPGRRRVSALDFANAERPEPGEVLGGGDGDHGR